MTLTKNTLITANMLRGKRACEEQVDLFESLFPNGTKITESLCMKYGREFDLNWFTKRFFPENLREDYSAKRAPLWADYEAKHASLWEDYKAKRAPLLADYEAKNTPLLADYNAKNAPLWADYRAKNAILFWEVFSKLPE